ncbi:hypothetical protein TNIN_324471 [Trichonephila inaurata madagascariensis]|uniref:Uncharacterized protein n=1 Tax=Trichonephila inaurata madagascariensis TaxID=2747483 RepID=A0A8X7C9U0_9ARAC|nr:hypothetical protein TNIN_324471 [Trichonephila inaurata madagascariensis]
MFFLASFLRNSRCSCSSSTISSSSRSLIRMPSLLRILVPIKSSNGVHFVLRHIVLFSILCNLSTYLYHFVESSNDSLVRTGIKVRCIRSTYPFPLGMPVAICRC